MQRSLVELFEPRGELVYHDPVLLLCQQSSCPNRLLSSVSQKDHRSPYEVSSFLHVLEHVMASGQ